MNIKNSLLKTNYSFCSSNTISKDKEKQRNEIIEKAINISDGITAGVIGRAVYEMLNNRSNRYVISSLTNLFNQSLEEEQLQQIHNIGKNIVNQTLSKEGVSIINHNTFGEYYGQDELKGIFRNLPIPRRFVQSITRGKRNLLDSIAMGNNAQFNCDLNRILINQDSPVAYALLHEIGHAHNYNKSTFWKPICKFGCKYLNLIPTILIAHSLFSKEQKAKNNEDLTKKQKISNFLRNNVGKLIIISMIPKILEECRATYIGNSLGLDKLPHLLQNRVRRMEEIGIISYLLNAIVLATTAAFGKSIKDLMDENFELKNKNKQKQINVKIENRNQIFNEFIN